jgi:hypothetical protein
MRSGDDETKRRQTEVRRVVAALGVPFIGLGNESKGWAL